MGLLNQIWWGMGLIIAVRIWIPSVDYFFAGGYQMGTILFVVGLIALFLPEYIRWRLLGGSSIFERVPLVGVESEA